MTAPTGAAVRDIMNISARRNPYVQLLLYPAQVQGEGAKESIVRGIRMLETKNVDVIIEARSKICGHLTMSAWQGQFLTVRFL